VWTFAFFANRAVKRDTAKVKIFNRKGRKGIPQRSQRTPGT